MTVGENGTDLSSSLTLKISNENCGESDPTAEHMAEGVSSSLDRGSALEFANFHEQGQILFPLVLNSEGNVEMERGIAVHNKSFRCGVEKEAEIEKWLQLGLGSVHSGNGAKCPPLGKKNHKNFSQDSSPANKEHRSGLNIWNQPFIPSLCPQVDFQFPYGVAYGRGMASSWPYLDRNELFCSQRMKISAEYPFHKHVDSEFEERCGFLHDNNFTEQNSQQSPVIHNVGDILQIQRRWSGDSDSAWIRSGEFRLAISDISVGRKLSSNALPGIIQYQSTQNLQPLVTYKQQHRQISSQFAEIQQFPPYISPTDQNGKAFAANISATENEKALAAKSSQLGNRKASKLRNRESGVWFKLQVAPSKDGDRLLPQIPKTYLRIKDGTTTVLLVKKYLASKLGLKSELEIDITCRGEAILPLLTLQHVRDKIWYSKMMKDNNQCKMFSSSIFSNECLMILNYQRSFNQ